MINNIILLFIVAYYKKKQCLDLNFIPFTPSLISEVTKKGILMKINLSGHHVDVTSSVKEHIEGKFSKISTHFPTLISADVIISKEHGKHQVEITTNYEGSRISTTASEDVMYPAIASAVKKLDSALKHRKGQLKANLHAKPNGRAPDIAHEKVQEMQLS